MLRKLAAVALCAASLVFAPVFAFDRATSGKSDTTKIEKKHLIGNALVVHTGNGFKVNNQKVSHAFLDVPLRGISKDRLNKLLASGSAQIRVRTIEDQYGLELRHQLKGGGPNLGYFVYCATKTICYGCMGGAAAAGATAVAVAVLPASAPAAASAGVGYAIGVGAPAALTSSTGVGLVAAVAASSPTVVTATTIATAEMVATTGSIAATIAAVESFSLFMGALAGMTPTP